MEDLASNVRVTQQQEGIKLSGDRSLSVSHTWMLHTTHQDVNFFLSYALQDGLQNWFTGFNNFNAINLTSFIACHYISNSSQLLI